MMVRVLIIIPHYCRNPCSACSDGVDLFALHLFSEVHYCYYLFFFGHGMYRLLYQSPVNGSVFGPCVSLIQADSNKTEMKPFVSLLHNYP